MANPIIQRELVGTLRTGKAFAIQLLLVSLLALLILIKWPSDATADLRGLQAQQVMRLFAFGLLGAVMLLAPAFPATSLVNEKIRGTLTLLLHAPMSRVAILLGKMVGSLGFVVLLLILSLPGAMACLAMGGVDPVRQMGAVYLVLFLLAFQYAAMGLWVSSKASSADAALRLTYGLVLLLAVVSLGPHYFMQEVSDPMLQSMAQWMRSLSPIAVMMQATALGGLGEVGALSDGLVGRFAMLSGGLTVLFLFLTFKQLDMKLFDRAQVTGKVTDERSTQVRFFRRLMYLWFFDPQKRSGLIGPLTNPVMAKEFRSRRFGRSNWTMRLIFGCLILSLLLTLATAQSTSSRGGHTQTIGVILSILQMALILLLTPSLASSLICGELESRGWQLLQMTPLSASRILFGKLISVLWTLFFVLGATLPGYVVLIYIDNTMIGRVLEVFATMILTAFFALLLSGTISSFCKATAQATAMAYGVLITLVAGTLLLQLGRGTELTGNMLEKLLVINPMAVALSRMKVAGFEDYQLLPDHWYAVSAICVVLLLILLARIKHLIKPS